MEDNVIFTGKEEKNVLYRLRRAAQQTAGRIFPKELLTKIYFRILLKRPLDLKNPITFNEKIQWYKLYYCAENEKVIRCTDKYTVRQFVSDRGFEDTLPGLIGVWNRAKDICWDDLPEKFALKCNHGCGYNIICHDKSRLDRNKAIDTLERWMKEDFGLYNIEPHYNKIPKRILCEEFIETEAGFFPIDYKFFCFHGVPKFVAVYTNRDSSLTQSYFDLDWNPLDIGLHNHVSTIGRPRLLEQAIEVAKELARDFPFVRVDLYDCDKRIVFGELTFTPVAGFSRFFSYDGDLRIGKLLELPKMDS